MSVAVGIKALNEIAHIRDAIESARAALARVGGGTIVLADSGSTDGTVEIGLASPGVRVMQLADPTQRSCGAGAQLAWQSVEADYFYLLDGDMVLDPDFLPKGIAFLEANPRHAAVGGRVREANTASIEFELRARNDRQKGSALPGDVDRLDCGGLYRGSAIRALGYFADRNLHAFEEFDLGMRLAAAGWRLARIDVPAVEHHGHTAGGLRLMWRRLKTGYAAAPGEVVRAAWARPHWPHVLRNFRQLRYGAVVYCWWLLLLAALAAGSPLVFIVLLLSPLAFLTLRRGNARLAMYSLVHWNVNAIGLLQGICKPRRPAEQRIGAIDLTAKLKQDG